MATLVAMHESYLINGPKKFRRPYMKQNKENEGNP
jgi:hypothetical protein